MRSFILMPILIVGMILQSAIFGHIKLLSGTPDIVLLILVSWNLNKDEKAFVLWAVFAGLLFSIYSSAPLYLPLLTYLTISFFTRKLKSITYHLPIFLLIFATLLAGVIFYGAFVAQQWITSGFRVELSVLFWQIAIPSIFLDLLLTLPINSVIKEFVKITDPNIEIL